MATTRNADGDHKECRVSASVAKNSVSHALSCAGEGVSSCGTM